MLVNSVLLGLFSCSDTEFVARVLKSRSNGAVRRDPEGTILPDVVMHRCDSVIITKGNLSLEQVEKQAEREPGQKLNVQFDVDVVNKYGKDVFWKQCGTSEWTRFSVEEPPITGGNFVSEFGTHPEFTLDDFEFRLLDPSLYTVPMLQKPTLIASRDLKANMLKKVVLPEFLSRQDKCKLQFLAEQVELVAEGGATSKLLKAQMQKKTAFAERGKFEDSIKKICTHGAKVTGVSRSSLDTTLMEIEFEEGEFQVIVPETLVWKFA